MDNKGKIAWFGIIAIVAIALVLVGGSATASKKPKHSTAAVAPETSAGKVDVPCRGFEGNTTGNCSADCPKKQDCRKGISPP